MLGCRCGLAGDSVYSSEHFTLKTDVSRRKAERMLAVLEKLRPRHLSELGLLARPMPKMSLHVVADRSRFNAIAASTARRPLARWA